MSIDELGIEKKWLLLAHMDPEKFKFFFDKYYDRIYRFAFLRTMDHDAAEDITSATFIQAQKSLRRFRWLNLTMGAWFYRIARNRIKEHYRRESKTLRVSDDDMNYLPGAALCPLTEIILSEDQSTVYKVVMNLDQLSRDIFLMHYWENCTTKEISVILNIAEGTVKSRLTREREMMEDLVEPPLEEGWQPSHRLRTDVAEG